MPQWNFTSDCTPFQSTPSAWRETIPVRSCMPDLLHFNPLPPHGGRRSMILQRRKQHDISIHSLHTEGDLLCSWHCIDRTNISIHSLHTEGDVSGYSLAVVAYSFQSTPSTRRETNDLAESEHDNEISIHSLHTEGDAELTAMAAEASQNFNPLPPHGGRQQKIQQIKIQLTFQSTPSTRRETHSMAISAWFSIFQSTPSTRRETRGQHHSDGNISFQSTPSTRRETVSQKGGKHSTTFQSTPSTRRETKNSVHHATRRTFQSTPSTRRETRKSIFIISRK